MISNRNEFQFCAASSLLFRENYFQVFLSPSSFDRLPSLDESFKQHLSYYNIFAWSTTKSSRVICFPRYEFHQLNSWLESSVCVILLSVGGVLAEASSYELCIPRSISRFIHCNRSRRHPVINNHNKYFTIILKCRHSMNRSICKYPFTLTRMRNHVCYRIFNHGWMFYANLLWITTKHI